jgi:hypothetical protein
MHALRRILYFAFSIVVYNIPSLGRATSSICLFYRPLLVLLIILI